MTTVREHLVSRHMDLDLHRPHINEEERAVTFLLWNLSGQIVGYQRYRPDETKEKHNDPRFGRYFTRVAKHTIAVWGLESVHLTPTTLFVTEGVFDAARLTNMGYSAIAVLSCDVPHYLRTWLNTLFVKTIAVCDGDAAGGKLAKLGDRSVSLLGHDLGDADDDEVRYIVEQLLN